MYHAYNTRPIPRSALRKQRRGTPRSRKPLIIIPCVLVIYIAYALLRPLPAPRAVITPPVTPALVKVNIPWPKSSDKEQAAYGASQYGLLATSTAIETASPTASLAKVITALAVLQKKPLKPGEQGPSITLTAKDVALYDAYAAKDGAVMPVTAGASITQYQALQAMLLSSANNITDTLALWAFGSLPHYTAYAGNYVKKLGMNATIVSDASGFAPSTVSTASDMVRLGDAALANPVITEIVGQGSAEFPGFGTIHNTNTLLGQSGVRGIKTGATDQGGGCFLGAADVAVGSETVRVITAVMAAPDLATAQRDSLPLIQSSPSQFQAIHVLRANQTIGTAVAAWGATSPIVSEEPITALSWTGTTLPALTTDVHVPLSARAGTRIGVVSLTFLDKPTTAHLRLKSALAGPSLWWRLTHPFS